MSEDLQTGLTAIALILAVLGMISMAVSIGSLSLPGMMGSGFLIFCGGFLWKMTGKALLPRQNVNIRRD